MNVKDASVHRSAAYPTESSWSQCLFAATGTGLTRSEAAWPVAWSSTRSASACWRSARPSRLTGWSAGDPAVHPVVADHPHARAPRPPLLRHPQANLQATFDQDLPALELDVRALARSLGGKGSGPADRPDPNATNQWRNHGEGPAQVTRPVQDLAARECPNFGPYPLGAIRLRMHPAASHSGSAAARVRVRGSVQGAGGRRAGRTRRVVRVLLVRSERVSAEAPTGRLSNAGSSVLREVGKPLSIEDVDLDEPRAGEVTVRIEAAGVCHSDLHYMNGDLRAKLPIVVGHEGAGVVEVLGPGTTDRLAVDDRVALLWRPRCGECEACAAGNPVQCRYGRVYASTKPNLVSPGVSARRTSSMRRPRTPSNGSAT